MTATILQSLEVQLNDGKRCTHDTFPAFGCDGDDFVLRCRGAGGFPASTCPSAQRDSHECHLRHFRASADGASDREVYGALASSGCFAFHREERFSDICQGLRLGRQGEGPEDGAAQPTAPGIDFQTHYCRRNHGAPGERAAFTPEQGVRPRGNPQGFDILLRHPRQELLRYYRGASPSP